MIVPPQGTAPSRILVYGVTGSGKPTLAARISAVTGLPWHGVDDLTWEPGWVGVPADEQRRRLSDICGRDAWILDSGHGAWIDIPLARVQLIVALDYPRWPSFGGLLRRTVVRLVDGTAICNGNREPLRHTLSRDSLLLWHCRSFGRKRRRIRGWLADPDGPAVQRFRFPGEAADWPGSMARPVGRLGRRGRSAGGWPSRPHGVEEYGCHLEVRWNRLAADDPVAAGLADRGVWCTSDPPGEGRWTEGSTARGSPGRIEG